MENFYSIKQVSTMTGLSSPTLRYYEEEGLIHPIQRNENGIRKYSDNDLTWISFLAKLKQMEMPISEMKKYAELRHQGASTVSQRKAILQAHHQRLEEKIAQLNVNLSLLDDKIKIYEELEKNA